MAWLKVDDTAFEKRLNTVIDLWEDNKYAAHIDAGSAVDTKQTPWRHTIFREWISYYWKDTIIFVEGGQLPTLGPPLSLDVSEGFMISAIPGRPDPDEPAV